ncbi:HAD-IA family hydrolase [Pseudoroseicyclus aestuarii]|uniref:phosphoglycolate phosphatase n=1 Tax=Pseudoroseicyclus aestuarii TaxID=1795041 RepID=A0A318SYG6_9RHOB|nr:HAD-IA family hydrolase [Pseudoroseicyclus aestuarii]PYE85396.1 phosphoglycolate phosphatase [Pseudoroseicyclus aestuarii]
MTETSPRCVIFDLDGTLVDSAADMINAANACLEGMGRGTPLDPEGDAATAFHGGRAMLRLGMQRTGGEDEGLIDAHFDGFLRAYGEAIAVHTVFYPGAREAVARLRARGHRVGICTNKPEGLAVQLLEALGARDDFDALVGADTLPVKKPDAAPLVEAVRRAGGDIGHCCLIGDTKTDRLTAQAAGVPSILTTFGPEGALMPSLDPDGLLPGFEMLDSTLAALD